MVVGAVPLFQPLGGRDASTLSSRLSLSLRKNLGDKSFSEVGVGVPAWKGLLGIPD